MEKNIKKNLSYFSSENYEIGSLIKVKIRNKNTIGLVTETKSILDEKIAIRKMGFPLKKVVSKHYSDFLLKPFLESTREIANFYATTQGAVLRQLIPDSLLENQNLIKVEGGFNITANNIERINVLQANTNERYDHYRTIIRTEFAKKHSVFICVSRNDEAIKLKEFLGKGIEKFIATPETFMSKKDMKAEVIKAVDRNHPVLVIATGSWLFLPRTDWGLFIIEGENSNNWSSFGSPFIDMREVTKSISKHYGATLVLGDSFLRIETLYQYKNQKYGEFGSVKWRLSPEVDCQIFDKSDEVKLNKDPKILSSMILEKIEQAIKSKKNVFIYSPRKGLASSILCRDCGQTIECSNCNSPMVLYRLHDENIFRCHQCGEKRSSKELCKMCGGWRLISLGSGSEKISDEVSKHFKDTYVFEISKDKTKTSKQVKDTISNFFQKKGSVLVATEMALPYIYKPVPLVVAASLAPLFSIPNFKINEKIFKLVLELRNMAKDLFVAESYGSDKELLEKAVKGDVMSFYQEELSDRELLNYPPFSIFIKITVRGTKEFVERESATILDLLDSYDVTTFHSLHEKKGQPSAINIVIKQDIENYPDIELIAILKDLPLHFEVKVSPDNLL